MAKNPRSKNKDGTWSKRSASTGRIASSKADGKPFKGVSKEAREFSRQFNEQYREALRELSKR